MKVKTIKDDSEWDMDSWVLGSDRLESHLLVLVLG